jgi:hypothetical protein
MVALKKPTTVRKICSDSYIEKIKDLRVNSRTTEAFKIGGEEIEHEDDLLYLGSKIDEKGGTLLDVQQRINKARGILQVEKYLECKQHQLTPQN